MRLQLLPLLSLLALASSSPVPAPAPKVPTGIYDHKTHINSTDPKSFPWAKTFMDARMRVRVPLNALENVNTHSVKYNTRHGITTHSHSHTMAHSPSAKSCLKNCLANATRRLSRAVTSLSNALISFPREMVSTLATYLVTPSPIPSSNTTTTTTNTTNPLLPRMVFEDNPICQVFFWDGKQGGCTFLTGSRKTGICRMNVMRLGNGDGWQEGDCFEAVVGSRGDDTSGVWESCEIRRGFRTTCPA
ncbi:hypothetical protein HYFRA_00008759 [Hymenoscyphus fraxineus]|uniref:Uncharacterized protein n=1 Tax=Hymenoscyphus fraxineus TaxID=746836 RepID=A0A9N9L1L4_9HELO|nr:hypothetical protein HYFRA_00008759 [Hymenoscyphus fraxineus]